MSNDNYLPLLSMGADDYYTAAQAGPFNEVANVGGGNPHVALAAFCAFILDGGYQGGELGEDSPPAEQWLWGNFDVTEKSGRGWSLSTRADANGQLTILARCTCEDGTVLEAEAPVTGAGLVSPFETIIYAGLWYSGSDPGDSAILALTLNGAIAATAFTEAVGTGGYLPSPYAARLGADPVTATIKSFNVRFVSCGYGPVPNTMAGIGLGDAGVLAGSTFRAFYNGYSDQSFILQDAGYDWKHRYDARSLASGLAGNVTKTTRGAYMALTGLANGNYPIPGAVLADLGNQSPNPLFTVSPFTPVQLNATFADPITARLMGVKNAPYYAPPSFTYPTAP